MRIDSQPDPVDLRFCRQRNQLRWPHALLPASGQLANPTPWSFSWSLAIPPLPPGLTLHLQHVSMGADPTFWQLHFGVSNAVE